MRSALRLTLGVIASTSSATLAADGDYPFLGMWDCEIAVLTFSADDYHDGTNQYPLTNVTAEGDGFAITLTPDYVIGLSSIEPNKMRFAPMVGGDQFACFRLE